MSKVMEEKIEIIGVILVDTVFLIEFVFFIDDLFNNFITFWKIFQLFIMFLFCIFATYSLIHKKSFFDKFFNKNGTIKDKYKEYFGKK